MLLEFPDLIPQIVDPGLGMAYLDLNDFAEILDLLPELAIAHDPGQERESERGDDSQAHFHSILPLITTRPEMRREWAVPTLPSAYS